MSECADGAQPSWGLTQATDGNLYGTTTFGGTYALADFVFGGTVFKLTTSGALTTLYSFCYASCGGYPSGLLQSTDGNLYGMTSQGGASGYGMIYKMSTGLPPFVKAIPNYGGVGTPVIITGNRLQNTISVTFNGTPTSFRAISGSEIETTVPTGATTGTVVVTTPNGTLSSNVAFVVRKAASETANLGKSPTQSARE